MMRAAVVLALLVLACHSKRPLGNDCAYSLPRLSGDCDGTEYSLQGRSYCVHAPAETQESLPVVLLLHGFASTGERQSHYLGFDDLVASRHFLLVKPNGNTNRLGLHYWNATPACCAPEDGESDDTGYLSSVLDDVARHYHVDASRVYAVGHSNGGYMAHRMACERSDRFAAMVSLAGAVDPESCRPKEPVAVAEVHGTTDFLVKYNGGRSLRRGASYVSADTTVATWAKANRCTGGRSPAAEEDYVCGGNGSETIIERYSGCPKNGDVELWRMNDIGHVPNFARPAWPNAVLDFLFAHKKGAR